MSDKLNLGQPITTEQHRDAIHIAVAPVEAGEWLAPGQHIRLAASGKAVAGQQSECIGIVSDLNAMADAERALDANQQLTYAEFLHGFSTARHHLHRDFDCIHSSASLRAECFLRTFGKWEGSA